MSSVRLRRVTSINIGDYSKTTDRVERFCRDIYGRFTVSDICGATLMSDGEVRKYLTSLIKAGKVQQAAPLPNPRTMQYEYSWIGKRVAFLTTRANVSSTRLRSFHHGGTIAEDILFFLEHHGEATVPEICGAVWWSPIWVYMRLAWRSKAISGIHREWDKKRDQFVYWYAP